MSRQTTAAEATEATATEPEGHRGTRSSGERVSVGSLVREYATRVRGGDVGSLPAILGLVALVITFSVMRPKTFTTELNFANLINQSAGVMVLAMGLVFVLLLGEIDLSAGYAGGTSAAVLGIVATQHGWPWIPALLAAIATGAVIGVALGVLVAKVGIPSFIVTLAAFLALQGATLKMIGEGGTIAYRDEMIVRLNNANLPLWAGWALAAVVVAGFALVSLRKLSRRRRLGLVAQSTLQWALKSVALGVAVFAVVAYLSRERAINPQLRSLKGVPVVVLVIAILVVALTYLLTRTSWGRHVYAVGGNAEAARRAGINVAWIRVSCFMVCSSMAAIAGVLIASRDNSVSAQTGGSETLLYAVGAAVIGGTSLFGGKGRVTDAVIGGLVIAVIANGMGLLNKPAGTVYMVTGGVLLVAAAVDAISRRRASATGRV